MMITRKAALENLLCFGDNLTFLKNTCLFPDESVDLIYLDPPFNSKRPYNVLFKDVDGTPSAAQIKAFDDTWHWDQNAADKLLEIQATAPAPLVELLKALYGFLGHSEMYAYLVQMGVRLVQLHRVLKRTGSLYLHCDPTASHYLKMMLDAVFGAKHFRNEIIWQRTSAHNDPKRYGRNYDCILYYSKSSALTWNPQSVPYSESYVRSHYAQKNDEGYYTTRDLTAPDHGKPSKNLYYEWNGVFPPKGRTWTCVLAKMREYHKAGLLSYSKEGMPRLKRYLKEMPGVRLQALWTDIPPINAMAKERLGYPTQKPITLLMRIIQASSNPGDMILDPFCGCGTTIDAVETLNRKKDDKGRRLKPRRWIGMDITHLAIHLIKHRLSRFDPPVRYEVLGEPTDLAGAQFLARKDRFQFQFWALGLIGARAWGGIVKKGADRGIDGVRYFTDEANAKPKKILVQVKSGHVKAGDLRDFRGVLERENAAIGVFLTLEEPTKEMRAEAAAAGHYHSPGFHRDYPRLQILSIADLLADPQPWCPRCLKIPAGEDLTFQRPPEYRDTNPREGEMDLLEPVPSYEAGQESGAQ